MAVTVDTTNVLTKSGSSGTSITFNGTLAGGDNMIVISGGERSTISTSTKPTWNTTETFTTLTPVAASGCNILQTILSTSTTGTQSCTVTFSASTYYVVFFIPLSGTNGIRGVGTGSNSDGSTTGNGSTGSPSITVQNGATGDLVIDSVTSGGGVTVNGSQTQIGNLSNANGNGCSSKAGGSSVVMSWSTASAPWASSAISVKASGGGAPTANPAFLLKMLGN